MTDQPELFHATAVASAGGAAMIVGPSGAGKSALGLLLLALGAELVADDCCALERQGDDVLVSRPTDLPQMIEVRGFGLIPVPCCPPTPLRLIVDLEASFTSRLPETCTMNLLGCDVVVMTKIDGPHFSAAIMTYLASCSGKGRPVLSVVPDDK